MEIRPAISFAKNRFGEKELTGAEIGVQTGIHAQSILDNLKIKELILIDIWGKYVQEGQSINFAEYYREVKKRFRRHNNVKILRRPSIKAVIRFADAYFDFVYIDGCHTYDAVIQDLNIWYPKIKQGGILCGHDFTKTLWPGVVKAVLEFCNKNTLKLNSSLTEANTRSDWWIVKE